MMQGLLGIDDPRTAGLLSLGLRLMSTPGKFSTALGQSGLGALTDAQRLSQANQIQRQRDEEMRIRGEMLRMQQAEQARKAQQEQERNAYLASIAGQMGPPERVNPAAGMRAGLGPQELSMLMPGGDDKPLILGPGAMAIDPRTGRQIGAAPFKPEAPDEFDAAMARAGIKPGSPEYLMMARAYAQKKATHAPAPSATVVMPTQEKEEAKAVGKAFGDQYAEIQKAGFDSARAIARADQMAQLMEGVNTGKLTPIGTEVAAFAKSLGIDIDPKLGNKQAIEAIANEMALEMRNPAGGAGMPGALSDRDREFLVKIVPGLAKTPEGNRIIMTARKKLAQRNQDVAKLARQYRMKRGTLDEGFFDELEKWSAANPLFDTEPGKQAGPYTDAEKERRYQEWKRQQGRP